MAVGGPIRVTHAQLNRPGPYNGSHVRPVYQRQHAQIDEPKLPKQEACMGPSPQRMGQMHMTIGTLQGGFFRI